jgi:hypothetical protein
MFSVDEFVTAAPDARVARVAVAIVLGWPSTRGLSVATLRVSWASARQRFREMAGLGPSA